MKKILAVEVPLNTDDVQFENFDSKISLLDWDVVLFRPTLSSFINYRDTYLGKPSLSEAVSFRAREASEHWRREIKNAFDSGKTIIVFLPELQEVYVDTGRRTHSGTGRSRITTNHVEPYSNYQSIPVEMKVVSTRGKSMKLNNLGEGFLASYWSDFSSHSEYDVLLPEIEKFACVVTKTGDQPVGAIYRSKSSSGSLVLLPNLEFEADAFFDEDDEGELYWNDASGQFASRLLKAVVALDKGLQSASDITPEPTWAVNEQYLLEGERALQTELLEAERQVEDAQKKKEGVQEAIRTLSQSRSLLYEKGKPLEIAILNALTALGFSAAHYKADGSEFDVVFECDEGRLLGEAEGKDAKAINVTKLRQLAMNIHEDLARDEVSEPAKGVLFGNGYRLSSPEEREVQFTDKCLNAARASSAALVPTTELFKAIRYLSYRDDEEYARSCRACILNGIGLVVLPEPPSA